MNDQIFQKAFAQLATELQAYIKTEVEAQVSARMSGAAAPVAKTVSNNSIKELEEMLNSFVDNGDSGASQVDELLSLLEDFSSKQTVSSGTSVSDGADSLQDLLQGRVPSAESDQVDFYIDALSSLRPTQAPATMETKSNTGGIGFALNLLKKYRSGLNK
ncbi:MAG: hypothetical protein COU63_01540 [Candidatus Pacebacteria bacterium CG10_big_fil_rev_8_21_14_0_10_36_11]|nr:hypothetical protein [Candidatus Pacearchaeota archaeon]OIP73729.1 MAG: hypothetical protein AUK08_04180 [Candidatus Pacebacteria bacterium CG2_30_36_39]PIR64685.1 MAG: hypothetical protein COU63_01540 [Candidatus Pacebacteria bacterium CG10_big_fil_rev_8_21_14_0_10_36_11]PJC42754.1 MAG: hypothetical protein CO040_02920 [Candidatus Pacebacteria bacterium CG_4_9_14_0_2_um_filter_36_8]